MFKFIHISDTDSLPCEGNVILIEGKLAKRAKPKGSNAYNMELQPLALIEAMQLGTYFKARITIDTKYIKKVKEKQNGKYWLDFKKRFEMLFGKSILEKSEIELANAIIERIKKALINIQNTLNNSDYDFINSVDNKKGYAVITDLLDDIVKEDISPKLGAYSSFISKTIIDSIKKTGQKSELYKNYLKAFNKMGLGNTSNPKLPKNPLNNLEDFPKSRAVAVENPDKFAFGWINIEFTNRRSV